MKIETNDIQAHLWRKTDDPSAVQQATEQARDTANRSITRRVRDVDTVEVQPDTVQTYDRHSRLHAADERLADQQADRARQDAARALARSGSSGEVAMFANVAGIWSDFASIGMVPPPERFAGIDVVTPSDLRDPILDDVTDCDRPRPRVTSSDRVQMMVIRDILKRITSAETTEAQKQALAAQLGPEAQALAARTESADEEETASLNVSL